MQIQTAALPAGPQSYTLYFNSLASPFSIITHSAWSYSTTPIAHTLCGTISYTATFEGSSVDTTTITSRNVVYNSNTRTFGIYSENFALIGTKTVTVFAYFTDYPQITAGPTSTTMTIVNPCLTPVSVTATAQVNPSAYSYTGASPKLQFVATPFSVNPSVCPVTYSCSMQSGPRTDLCTISDGTTIGVFSSSTGDFNF